MKGATFLDCFAGSGAIGLEALSRGAVSCLFVEKDRHSADILQKNIDLLGDSCRERSTLVRGDALGLSVVARCPRPLDLAFFDPPYPLIRTRLGWERVVRQCSAVAALLADDGFLMLRTPLPHMIEEDAAVGADGAGADQLKARRFRKHEKPRADGRGKGKWDKGAEERRATGKGGKGLVIGGERVEPLSDEELESLAGGGGSGGPDDPGVVRTIADWSIPGARGPETHEYGSTAVHFYMKRQEAEGGGGG